VGLKALKKKKRTKARGEHQQINIRRSIRKGGLEGIKKSGEG